MNFKILLFEAVDNFSVVVFFVIVKKFENFCKFSSKSDVCNFV